MGQHFVELLPGRLLLGNLEDVLLDGRHGRLGFEEHGDACFLYVALYGMGLSSMSKEGTRMMGYKRWPYLMALIRKEILATLKEKSSRAILLGPIIIYTVLFGYIATFNLDRVPYALCDLSHSAASFEFIRAIDQNQIFHRVETLQNTAQIDRTVEKGDALLVVVIEPQFAQKLKEGKAGQIQVIVDGRNSSTAQLAVG